MFVSMNPINTIILWGLNWNVYENYPGLTDSGKSISLFPNEILVGKSFSDGFGPTKMFNKFLLSVRCKLSI